MQEPVNTATYIITHPQHFARHPAVLAANWERLKNARGQIVDHDRIGPPAYIIGPECPSIAAARIARIPNKVREIARDKGYDLPPSAA